MTYCERDELWRLPSAPMREESGAALRQPYSGGALTRGPASVTAGGALYETLEASPGRYCLGYPLGRTSAPALVFWLMGATTKQRYTVQVGRIMLNRPEQPRDAILIVGSFARGEARRGHGLNSGAPLNGVSTRLRSSSAQSPDDSRFAFPSLGRRTADAFQRRRRTRERNNRTWAHAV
jgi:hypothetical protein